MQGKTCVQKGYDFAYKGKRYQVKGNRPSGKPGSFVTLVPKARNYDWDYLIWILYNSKYEIQEAWLWEVAAYERARTTRLTGYRPHIIGRGNDWHSVDKEFE